MNFWRNHRGAVSVFIIIVLVPCIAISCIFVDVSRVQLSQTMANSSADLALNTLLTNYDAKLSEYYGLIGSCQSIDQFYEESADFFLRTLKSQNLGDDEIFLLSDYYSSFTGDDTIYDLLQVECEGATITPVAGANLGNPAMLKDSIVEFMKYRAPIEMTTALIGRIKDNMDQVDGLVNAKKNEPLVESKEQFYETEGELLNAAIYTYLAIKAYDEKVSGQPKYSVEKLKFDEQEIAKFKSAYQQMHKIAVNNLLNTGALINVYQVPKPSHDLNHYYHLYDDEKLAEICSSTKENDDGTVTYYINKDDFDVYMQAAANSLSSLNTAISNYSSATYDLMQMNPDTNSEAHPVQWWMDMHNAVFNNPSYGNVHDQVKTHANAVMKAFAKLWAIEQRCEEEPAPNPVPQGYQGLPSDWKTQCEGRYDEIYRMWVDYLGPNPQVRSGYVDAAMALANVSAENQWRVKPNCTDAGSTVNINGAAMSVENAVRYIAGQLSAMHKTYSDIIKLLDKAIDGDIANGGKTESLETLLTLAEKYETDFKKYKQTASNTDTDLGEQERDEISTELELAEEINKVSVQELKTRLENIRDQFSTIKIEIETLTYGGTPLKDINNFNTFRNCALTVVKDADISNMKYNVDVYADETCPQLLKPTTENEIKLTNTDKNTYNPDLDVEKPSLYKYLEDELKDYKPDEKEDNEEDEKAAEEAQKKFEENEKKNAKEYRGNKDATMSNAYGWSETFGLTDTLGAVVDVFKSLTGGNLAAIRDDMYVTTYVMEMFSHASYDREAMYRMLTTEQRQNMSPGSADSYLKDTCGVYGSAETDRGKWLSSNVQDSYNKTLTNKMINHGNNHIYLAEVEYLLYGQSTPQANLDKSYGNIYALRFILNTISGYQHFWTAKNPTGGIIEAIALALSGATAGIVPAPVFKVVLIPILAALETCKDASRLFAGMPVELYKLKAEDWWVSFGKLSDMKKISKFVEGLTTNFTTDAGKNQDKGFFYSDYLTVFVYCAFSNGTTEADAYKRLAELIDANMAKIAPKKEGAPGFTLMKTHMYFQIDATVRVKPLMITLPYVQQYGTSMETATDWCTYDVHLVRGYS